MRLVLVALLLTLIASPANADIQVGDLQNIRPSGDHLLTTETTSAITFWRARGVTACPDGIQILIAEFPGLQIDGGNDCSTYYDSYFIGSTRNLMRSEIYSFEATALSECAIVYHETGHAMGLDHTPKGVMAETPEPPWECRVFARDLERASATRARRPAKHSTACRDTHPRARTACRSRA